MYETRNELVGLVTLSMLLTIAPMVGVAQETTSQVTPPKAEPQELSAERHKEIMAAPGREECEIAFVGGSIVAGWADEDTGKEIWDKEYAQFHAQNLGCEGDTAANLLWRLNQGELDGMPKLKVVVLMIGSVDTVLFVKEGPEVAGAGVKAVVEKVKEKAPQARILLMGLLLQGNKEQCNLPKVNALIAGLADGKQVFFHDIRDALAAWKCPHCNRAGGTLKRGTIMNFRGYEIWANEIRPMLERLMK